MKKIILVSIAILLVLFTLSAACQPSKSGITVLSPKGGETIVAGEIIPFSWQWTGSVPPLQPVAYLVSVESGQIIYGSMSPSSISYNPGAGKQTGSLDAVLYYPGVPPGFIAGGKYKIKICEFPENTNNPAYPATTPVCGYSEIFLITVPR